MTPRLNLRAVTAWLRTRRGATVAVLVAVALMMSGLASLNHHSDAGQPRASTVPLLSAPHTTPGGSPSTAASASAAASPSPTRAHDDGAGSDDNPASVSGYTQATITAGPTDPTDAAVGFLAIYTNYGGRTDTQWREDLHPLVTADLWSQLDQVDRSRIRSGFINSGSAKVAAVGDYQTRVTLNLIADQYHPAKVVDTLTITLDGSSHRWLVAQMDETKPGATG